MGALVTHQHLLTLNEQAFSVVLDVMVPNYFLNDKWVLLQE